MQPAAGSRAPPRRRTQIWPAAHLGPLNGWVSLLVQGSLKGHTVTYLRPFSREESLTPVHFYERIRCCGLSCSSKRLGRLQMRFLQVSLKHPKAHPYCGWTKSCTTLKPWETIVCWYLQGNRIILGFFGWCVAWISSISSLATCPSWCQTESSEAWSSKVQLQSLGCGNRPMLTPD